MDVGNHCASCVYFDSSRLNDAPPAVEAGLCRFNPPVAQPGQNAHGLWPVVRHEDWCGHHLAVPGRASGDRPARYAAE